MKNLISRAPALGARAEPGRAVNPKAKGLRLSTTWWLVNKLPVGEALALLTRLGYDAYEMFDWRDPAVLESFVKERGKFPLACATLVAKVI